jgi:hypothetical protein
MRSFVTNPELKALNKKFELYLNVHQIGAVLDACDIIQNPAVEAITGKLI